MSIGKRAFDVIRARVNHEWDRISGDERSSAEIELYTETLTATKDGEYTAVVVHVDYDALPPEERRAKARGILGVSSTATFVEIRSAYSTLTSRIDGVASPDVQASVDSDTVHKAQQLRRMTEWAYRVLSENFDAIEKRFGTLEID